MTLSRFTIFKRDFYKQKFCHPALLIVVNSAADFS